LINDVSNEELTAGRGRPAFFGVDPLPDPVHIPAAILTDVSPNRALRIVKHGFLCLMKQAMSAPTESAIVNLTQAVFRLMHYDDPSFLV
jgi:hypothetical protein